MVFSHFHPLTQRASEKQSETLRHLPFHTQMCFPVVPYLSLITFTYFLGKNLKFSTEAPCL